MSQNLELGMSRTEVNKHLIKYKFTYTAIIVVAYLLGRNIPLCGVDIQAYSAVSGNAEHLMTQAVGGDVNRYSLFALGISPLMISSILVQIFSSIRRSGTGVRIAPSKMNRMQLALTMGLALFQAVLHVQEMKFRMTGSMLLLTKAAAVIEMVTGVMVILWLTGRNRKYGFGSQTILIYVNVLYGMAATLLRHRIEVLALPLAFALAVMAVTLVMEGAEIRIPLQRISIENIYADKNYLAIKLNPVGAMPVMFSAAFFSLPQMAVTLLNRMYPESSYLTWWHENLVLTRPLGIGVYIAVLYLLTVGFAMMTISPGDIAEQFLKSGDSILNLHAGRDTRRYLTRKVLSVSFFSATVMSICMGIPMVLQLKGGIDRELVMFPASVMMLTGLWYTLYQEFGSLKNYEAYQPFL